MTINKIQLQIDLFQNLITNSRDKITEGHFVDISKLNININYLCTQIKTQHVNLSNTEKDTLAVSIETMLSDFNSLEKALNNQSSNLSAETKTWPKTVTQAYQN